MHGEMMELGEHEGLDTNFDTIVMGTALAPSLVAAGAAFR